MVSTAQFRELISEYLDEPAARVIEVLRELYPACDLPRIYACYYFMVGAMTFAFAQSGRLDALSRGAFRSSDLDAIYPTLVAFVSHVVEGIDHEREPTSHAPLTRVSNARPAQSRRSQTS
jgi:hypothetical protein